MFRSSQGRRNKEQSMRRRRLKKLIRRLRELQQQDLTRDELLLNSARPEEAGKPITLLVMHTPDEGISRSHPKHSTSRWTGRNYGRRGGASSYCCAPISRAMILAICGGSICNWSKVEQAFKEFENDLSDPAHLSQRDTRIEPIFSLRSCLLSAGHAETAAEGAGAGIDAESGARKLATMQMNRCRTAHHGRSAGRPVPLYGAGKDQCSCSTVEAPIPAQPPPKITGPEQREPA